MQFPNKEQVERVRAAYPVGTRVELVSMSDPYTELKPGDQGTVRYVDDTGTVFVDWDSGSGLGVIYGVDVIKRLPAITETIKEQIQKVRLSGKTNMLDVNMVQRIAFDNLYCELVDFIETDRKAYQRFILTGHAE